MQIRAEKYKWKKKKFKPIPMGVAQELKAS